MEEYTLFIMFLLWCIVFIGGGMLARSFEKRQWNKGFCGECGEPWECFDMDSQGGRLYKDKNRHTVWISYNVDKKEK